MLKRLLVAALAGALVGLANVLGIPLDDHLAAGIVTGLVAGLALPDVGAKKGA